MGSGLMADVPRRYKTREDGDDFSLDEELALIQANRRGEPTPRFETEQYRQYKRAALEEAGLTEEAEEADSAPPDLSEMTSEQHFDRLRRGG